jgi:photosynthetic reaction center cytochrome c subunit
MKLWSRLLLIFAVPAALLLVQVPLARPQATTASKPQMAGEIFKNVQVLQDTTVDDFMASMGVMSAAVGVDCSECHANAGTDKVDWAADTPRKVMARRMTTMVNNINKQNFGGRVVVTCWTCHRGRDRPPSTPSMETVYGPGPTEMDDVFPQAPGQPAAEKYVDAYLQAIGGAQKLATLKSYVATGSSVGFGGFGGGGHVQIFAKFPDARATYIKFDASTERPDSDRIFDGNVGWIKTPLAVLSNYQLTGGERDGAKLDAELAFPGQIKQVLTGLRSGLETSISDLPGPSSQTSLAKEVPPMQDRAVNVVQGNGPGNTVATLYFDKETNLLLRVVRFSRTPIGRVPTQVDYSDYRDVGGIKMPFRLTFAWLDGRDALQINDIKTNVAIDAATFARPK